MAVTGSMADAEYALQDLAMVVGLCLEMRLYWEEFGCPHTARCRTTMREGAVPLPPWQLRWGQKQTRAKQRLVPLACCLLL